MCTGCTWCFCSHCGVKLRRGRRSKAVSGLPKHPTSCEAFSPQERTTSEHRRLRLPHLPPAGDSPSHGVVLGSSAGCRRPERSGGRWGLPGDMRRRLRSPTPGPRRCSAQTLDGVPSRLASQMRSPQVRSPKPPQRRDVRVRVNPNRGVPNALLLATDRLEPNRDGCRELLLAGGRVSQIASP